MQPLAILPDYLWMLAAAAIAGAVGGFGFELMPVHSQCHMGAVGTPHRLKGHSFDMGFFANILLGAITAVAVLYFFPPETKTVVTDAKGVSQTNMSYDLVKLIALSLIVGSAGPSFLSSIQGRLAGALNEQKTELTNKANAQVDKMGKESETDVTTFHESARRQVHEKLSELPHTVQEIINQSVLEPSLNGNGKSASKSDQVVDHMNKYLQDTIDEIHGICDNTEAELRQRIQTHVETAKKAIKEEVGLD
jgi:hypothetical protein